MRRQNHSSHHHTSGVPKGPVLGSMLRKQLNDGLLRIELSEGATMIGFADKITIILAASYKTILRVDTSKNFVTRNRGLFLVGFTILGMNVTPTNFLKFPPPLTKPRKQEG